MTLTNKSHHFGKKFGVIILLFTLWFSTSVSTGLSIVSSEHSIGVNFRKYGNSYLNLSCHVLSLTVTFLIFIPSHC